MKETTNYSLKKIELTDSPPDITVHSGNFDIIDAALKANADAISTKANSSQVLTNVPANAKFTETTINGKTGAIAKADITALGIPGQNTTYTAGTNITIASNKINNIITDIGTDPDWAGVKYKWVMIDGELFAEVVEV